MIKGAIGKQEVKTKGMAIHGVVGDVGNPLQMKGQVDKMKFSKDSVMKSMSMKKASIKGCC